MNPGMGTAVGVAMGAIWGLIWMFIVAVTFMLASGAATVPPIGAAMLAGAVCGGLIMAFAPGARTPGLTITALAAIAMVLALFTFGAPLNLPLSIAPLAQLLAIAAFVGLVWFSVDQTVKGQPSAKLTRYQLEVILIRLGKGLGLVFFSVMVALPFYVMVMTSLKNQAQLIANPLDFSLNLGQGPAGLFSSYIELFTVYNFGTFLMNTAIVSIGTVIITLSFAVPGAYAVARLRFPGQAFLSRSILLIYMVPAIVLVIPLYAVFSQLGLRNTLTGLLIVYPATTIPVALYMLQGYFRGIPSELEEAGLMDGLTRAGVISKITLPLSLPALASVALYVFMIAWNEFLFAFMFLDNIDIFTLSRGVVSLNSSEVPRQHLMAGAVIATIPVLVLFLWFERFLVSGLTAGSVKG